MFLSKSKLNKQITQLVNQIRLTHLQIQHIDYMSISINIQGHNTSSIPDNPRQFIFKSPSTHQLSQLIYEVNINESSLSQVSTGNVRKSKDESTHHRVNTEQSCLNPPLVGMNQWYNL